MVNDGNSLHFEYCFDTLEDIFLSRSNCPDNTTLHIKITSRTKLTSLPKSFSMPAILIDRVSFFLLILKLDMFKDVTHRKHSFGEYVLD